MNPSVLERGVPVLQGGEIGHEVYVTVSSDIISPSFSKPFEGRKNMHVERQADERWTVVIGHLDLVSLNKQEHKISNFISETLRAQFPSLKYFESRSNTLVFF